VHYISAMTWRFFSIRIPLIVCLLFGTGAFAKKKPPAQPVNINAATSEELQLVPGIGLHNGQNSADAQVVRSVQDSGRFAGDSRAWAEAA
jgi:hypothetical protein